MHQQPGRVRGRLPVLRDRRAGLRPRPRGRRDRRPGPPRPSAARGRRAPPHERRLHGHGRAPAQPRRRARRRGRADGPGALRPRRAPHHGLDVGRRPGHRTALPAAAAVDPRDQPPRRPRSVARPPGPAQPPLARGGRDRRRPRLRGGDGPPGELRIRDDRRHQRHGGRCRRGGAAPARLGRPRQLHPHEPGVAHAVAGQHAAEDRGVRGPAAGRRPRRDRPAQPRPGGRCGLRPARGGAGRRAAGAGRGAAARAPRGRVGRRPSRRTQLGARPRGSRRAAPAAAVPSHRPAARTPRASAPSRPGGR